MLSPLTNAVVVNVLIDFVVVDRGDVVVAVVGVADADGAIRVVDEQRLLLLRPRQQQRRLVYGQHSYGCSLCAIDDLREQQRRQQQD